MKEGLVKWKDESLKTIKWKDEPMIMIIPNKNNQALSILLLGKCDSIGLQLTILWVIIRKKRELRFKFKLMINQ